MQIADLDKYPNLKKIVEEMAFDQGVARGYFFPHAVAVIEGKGENETVFDADRLETLAKFSVERPLNEVINLEEARKADASDYVNDQFLAEVFWNQLAAGNGEINDVIRAKGDWEYLLGYLDDVFIYCTPEELNE